MAAEVIPFSNAGASTPSPTTLKGAWLWLLRGLWLATCAASLGVFGALLPLILRANDYGDWMIERSARLFDIQLFSPAYDSYAFLLLGFKYLGVAAFVGVALYIFWRKSDDWMAILVSLTLLVIPHTFNLVGYTENWFIYPSPWDQLLYALDSLFNSIGLALLFFIFFLFPDGRFVPRWTLGFAVLPFLLVLILWVGDILHFNLIADDRVPWLALILVFLGLLLLAAWSQIYRYRHVSTRAQQTQTRLVVSSLVTIVTTLTIVFTISLFGVPFGAPSLMDSPLGALLNFLAGNFVLILLPLAFGVAMLRDHLWASDRVLNRALVYAALTVILLVIYVLLVAALSELFRSSSHFLVAALATGIVALLFQPVRERLQRALNRVVYGERDDPFRVLARLGAQLENTLTPAAALPLIVETIVRTLRVPYAAVELSSDGRVQRTEYGVLSAPTAALTRFPLKYQNETVGSLLVARRAPNEPFSAGDLQLLETLARQAGSVAYTARLNAALQESRERIIAEREQERRRLRRDLHDGLGPTLASQTLKLDAAIELLENESGSGAQARAILQDLKTQTQGTVAEIRRIVYELRPPALDDLGLVGALRAHLTQSNGASGVKIEFDAPPELPLLSAAVQVNAYRIILEAVHNVVKHARATHCLVRITCAQALVLEVVDDGLGLPRDLHTGVGLKAMRERAEELGGSFEIVSLAQGTRVTAALPLASQVQGG